MSKIKIRPYSQADKTALAKIMTDNTPIYFTPSEHALFEDFLFEYPETYLVVELEGEGIVAGGGLYVNNDEGSATFCWGMVAPEFQKKGIGRALSEYRIRLAREQLIIKKLICNTGLHTYLFFEKMGFCVVSIKKDEYGQGHDGYAMKMDL